MSLLEKLVASRVRAEILGILFGADLPEVYLRDLARRTGLALRTVQQDLEHLLETDLIARRKDGNRVYFSANPDHPLFEEIKRIVTKTTGALPLLQKALSGEEVKLAFIFGSFAKDEMRAGSDIDLFVVGDLGMRKLSGLLTGVTEATGREINPYVLSEQEFLKKKKSKDHFVTQVLSEKKIFIRGTENELKRMGK